MASLGIQRLPSFSRNIVRDPDLITDLLRLHRTLEDPTADELRQRELLVGCFGRLIRRHGTDGRAVALAPRDQALLKSVTELMQDRHAQRLTLGYLASIVGLTQFQLIGLFRRGVGMTPHTYLTQIRLDKARRLLTGDSSIALAAVSAGFYDQAALTRHFKRCYGITPMQFIRATES
jgi:AraC-like DNA-binding protein